MLHISSFKVSFTFPLLTRTLILDILAMVVALLRTFKQSSMVQSSCSSSSILLSVQSDSRPGASRCSFHFEGSSFEVKKLALHRRPLALLIQMVCYLRMD